MPAQFPFGPSEPWRLAHAALGHSGEKAWRDKSGNSKYRNCSLPLIKPLTNCATQVNNDKNKMLTKETKVKLKAFWTLSLKREDIWSSAAKFWTTERGILFVFFHLHINGTFAKRSRPLSKSTGSHILISSSKSGALCVLSTLFCIETVMHQGRLGLVIWLTTPVTSSSPFVSLMFRLLLTSLW